MKTLFLFSILLVAGESRYQQQNRFCDLRGIVYIAKEKSQADYIVYEEESKAFADFLVYEEDNRLYATEGGVWFFVENRGIADFGIFFTNSKGEADFVIAYTDSPTFAGCN
jgi:uncharacterized protein DUF6150